MHILLDSWNVTQLLTRFFSDRFKVLSPCFFWFFLPKMTVLTLAGVTKPLLVLGSTQVHQEAGTLVEGPGVRRCKWIDSGALAAFWFCLFVFAFTQLTSHMSVLRTLSPSTGPASTPAASSSSWAQGSSGKTSVSPKSLPQNQQMKKTQWLCREVLFLIMYYDVGNKISGDLWYFFSCVVPLTHPLQVFFVFCPLLSSPGLLLCKRLKTHDPLYAEMCTLIQFVPC